MGRALSVEGATAKDLTELPLRPELQADGYLRWTLINPAYARFLSVFGRTFRCSCHSAPLAIVGVTPLFLHTAEVWAFIASEILIPSHAGNLILALRKLEIEAARTLDLRRMQAVVDTKFDKGLRWAEREGFEIEGTLRNYRGDGRDFYRVAKLYGRPS